MATKCVAPLALVSMLQGVSLGIEVRETAEARLAANPIRKVVNMLHKVMKKVEDEGTKETEIYEKFSCYCKNGAADLENAIATSTANVPQVQSDIEEQEAQKAQVESDLTQHRSDREAAKRSMATAGALREREAAAFEKYSSDAKANIAALSKSVSGIEGGMAGSFLQSDAAVLTQKVVQSVGDMSDSDRNDVLEFFQGTQGAEYAPSSGQITGILKQLGDMMSANLADATASENESIKTFDGLMSAKAKEVEANTQAVETKTIRNGELSVSIVNAKNDLSETQATLVADKKFLANLDKNCAARAAQWDVIVKTRNEELLALSETISLLTDDDSLELFKKVLPGAAASLVQVTVSDTSARAKALAIIRSSTNSARSLDFISLALRGKQAGFAKVMSMIETMIDVLKQEQADDDRKLEFCNEQLDSKTDERKGLERSVSDSEKAIAETKDIIDTLSSEIEALVAGIKSLDNSVADASEQRKTEHADFETLMAQDTAATELIGLAKNRLYKFYEPKMYLPAPKRELSAEDRIMVGIGGTAPPTPAPSGIAGTDITALVQVSMHVLFKNARAGPPEATRAYMYVKSEESKGPIAMMDLLVQDLDKEMTVAQTEEQDAQKDYEQMLKDSKAKRTADSSSLTERSSAKADAEAALQAHQDDKASSTRQLLATLQVIQSTHLECDWLLNYHSMRKEARDNEIDSLKNAKAVLSGADYSLLETRVRSLRVRRFLAANK